MKKFIKLTFMSLAVMTLVFSTPVNLRASEISVTFDGDAVNFEGQGPVIVDYRTLVPVRGVFEALGFDVTWEQEALTATLTSSNYTVVISVGSSIFTTNGEEFVLDVPAQIIENRTLLPIRAVVESVGYIVEWDNNTRTVIISSPQYEVVPIGIIYINRAMNMSVLINNMEWRFLGDESQNAVSFFNYVTQSDDKLIFMSARPFREMPSNNFSQEVVTLWSWMRQNHADLSSADSIIYHDMQTITVGAGQYPGYLHPFEMIVDGYTFVVNAVFWSAGGMLYICTTSSLEDSADEVQGVLSGILESFISLESLN